MTRRTRRTLLSLMAAVCGTALIVVALNRDLLRDAKRPAGVEAMAVWLNEHPADWLAASAIADEALDWTGPRRMELWRAAYAHANRLAPHRRNPEAAFVRAGLFHWYELGGDDRARVLRAAGPLLRDPQFFARVHMPLWQLTRDFGWLHQHAPDTPQARQSLRNLALAQGLFAEYRLLREEVRSARMKAFAAQRRTAEEWVLLDLLPERIDRRDDPLVRGILEELERKPADPARVHPRAESLIDYAVRHDLRPLTGIAPLLADPNPLRAVTRARAALDLNNAAAATRIELAASNRDAADWQPYYLDRARFETRRRDAEAANGYLLRAAAGGATIPLLATARDVARAFGNDADAARYESQLLQRAQEPRAWSGTCGTNELCNSARAFEYVSGEALRVALATSQSDETAPYVEIYVDDMRMVEGEVRDARTFEIPVAPGLHEVEVRLVNTHTRNGAQRRVRLS